jgi:hypothetical protein
MAFQCCEIGLLDYIRRLSPNIELTDYMILTLLMHFIGVESNV